MCLFVIIHFGDFVWASDHRKTIKILLQYLFENIGFVLFSCYFYIEIISVLIPMISTFQSWVNNINYPLKIPISIVLKSI